MPPDNLNEQHVGVHQLHDDVSINFQLNRWVAWTGGDALPDIRRIAGRLTDFATNRRLFLELAETALAEGDLRRAAFHVRAAEFFVRGDDPEKRPLRARFVELLLRSRGMDAATGTASLSPPDGCLHTASAPKSPLSLRLNLGPFVGFLRNEFGGFGCYLTHLSDGGA